MYEGIWKDRQLDLRYVEVNHPEIVAKRIVEMEREIDKLRWIVKCLESKLTEINGKQRDIST